VSPVVVVIPSRGRPERAHQAVQAVRETAILVSTSVILAVDADDPELEAYRALRWTGDFRATTWLSVLEPEATGDLVKATNSVSMRVAEDDPGAIIGNLGDDHLCRTPGWDRAITAALAAPGVAYGDDLLQGAKLPTAPFISARIVNALGWFFLPTLTHMYPDNVVRDLGDRLGALHYLPEVVIEHVHPGAGKADVDDGYRRADASTLRDRDAYHEWCQRSRQHDVARVRHALEQL
jgi:hypothetical protein